MTTRKSTSTKQITSMLKGSRKQKPRALEESFVFNGKRYSINGPGVALLNNYRF